MTDATVPVIRELAQFLAELVSHHVMLYERVHYVQGKRYLVRISEYKTPDDTQPVRAVGTSGAALVRDEGIAD